LSWVEAAGGDEVVLEGERGGGGRGGGGEGGGACGGAAWRWAAGGGVGGGGSIRRSSPVEMEMNRSVSVRVKGSPFPPLFFSFPVVKGRSSFFPSCNSFFCSDLFQRI